jgi:hypothetical protein
MPDAGYLSDLKVTGIKLKNIVIQAVKLWHGNEVQA